MSGLAPLVAIIFLVVLAFGAPIPALPLSLHDGLGLRPVEDRVVSLSRLFPSAPSVGSRCC